MRKIYSNCGAVQKDERLAVCPDCKGAFITMEETVLRISKEQITELAVAIVNEKRVRLLRYCHARLGWRAEQ